MKASQRYKIVSRWRAIEARVFWIGGDAEDDAIRLIHEVADIRDTQDGHVYDSGARRVYATHIASGKSAKRMRTFYGDYAWDKAYGLYWNLCFEYDRESFMR